MKRKLQFLKTLLVAVGLSVGASDAWADVPTYTWDFTNTTTWATGKIATGSAVTLNPSAATPGVGEYGVTFCFDNNVTYADETTGNSAAIIGYNASNGSTYGTHLWYTTAYDGTNDINYVSVSVPVNFKVTFNMKCGRAASYKIGDGTAQSFSTTGALEYRNETASPVVVKVYATNPYKKGTSYQFQVGISSIVLEDYSAVSTHNWTVNAYADVSGVNTKIDTWSVEDIVEGNPYTVYAKKVILYGGQYYELDDAQFSSALSFGEASMGSADAVYTVNYTLREDIAYYAEGESLNAGQAKNSDAASSGKYVYYVSGSKNVDLSAGVYKLETNVIERGDKKLIVFKSDGTTEITKLNSPGTGFKTTLNFLVSESSIKVGEASGSNTLSFDYVIIRKVADVTDPSKIIGSVDNTTAENGASSSDIVLKDGDAYRITFQNHGSAAANKNHFIVNISNGGSKKASLYADWYDYTNDKGGWGYYFSNPYSANGGTSGNSVDWGTFATEMQDIPVTLNITYQNGKVNIIGTAPKNTNTYYWNYSYGKGVDGATDLTGDVTINLSVCLAWLEILSVEQTAVGATLGANGYTTFASSYPLDLTTANLPTGVKAYKAAVDGTVVRFTEFNQTVPANTGILLEGTANATVTIPVVASGDAVTGNAFLVNTTAATITSDASTYYFAMVKDSNPLKFGKVNSVNIPANKAYLQVPATNFTGTAPALTAIFDDGNTTGINAVKNAQFTENGEYYNLAGQRVAQPTKGLYIVNGRKVVVK